MLREFAAEAAAEGALVLYGACDAVVHTPYGPFVDALDQLVRATDPDELRAALGAAGGELTRLLPDLPARIGDLPAPVAADPDTERHRLHTAVTDLLAGASRSRPVLLVLEDGHWADAPTLLLMRHLARAGGAGRLLLLATFRDTEADVPEALSETLADLRRSEDVVRLRLAGLSDEDVAEFVRHAAGPGLSSGVPELASAISELTEGNAFLVCEFWRALAETGGFEVVDGAIRLTRPLAELGTPESVREVASQRLSRLAPGTTDLLVLAATAGTEFDLEIVRRAAGLGEPELLAAARRGGPQRDDRGASLARPRLPVHARARAAGALRPAHRGAASRAAPARRRGPRGGRGSLRPRPRRSRPPLRFRGTVRRPHDAGVDYNVRAAQAATAALAFDEAAERLRTALELRIESPAQRAEVYLDLGLANHLAGRALDALEAFRSAGDIAREIGDARLLARAAIGYEDACWRPGLAEEGAVELLEEASAALGDERSELRVGLLGGLARALDFQGDHVLGAAVRTEAVTMARDLDDRTGLATVLMRSYWSRGVSSLDEILAMLTEARDLGERLGNTEIRAEAIAWRVPTFVVLGDIESARREVASLRETAEGTAQPFMLHVAEHYGSAIALGDGRLEEAESMARRSHEWSRLLTGRDASGVHGIQMFSLRREQGRLAELAPVIRILAADTGRAGLWRPGLASMLVELGMEAEAREELALITAAGLDGFRASLWLASLTYLADACAALGDRDIAALVYPELEPLAGANVMIGHLVAFYGAADRYLGMLAATLGEPERAAEHFERALELNRRMGASTWLAHTAYEYARLLHARGEGGGERSAALLGEATALAERIGMATLLERIKGLGAGAAAAGLPDGLSAREAQILRLVARGLSNREIGGELFISRAHRRQPRAQHPAQDRLRQPDRSRVVRASPRTCRGVTSRAKLWPWRST